MNARTIAPPLTTLIGLSLLLASCGSSAQLVPGTPVASLSDSGAGSLRDLLAAAKSGDTLTFSAGGTVKLTGPLVVDKDVSIVADGVTLDAGGTGRALQVAPGANVNFKGGTLTNGKGQNITTDSLGTLGTQAISQATWGGLTYNQGTLILDGVTLTGGTANNGGAIYNAGTLTLKNVTMTNNTATIPTPDLTNESTGSGGAIANTGMLTIESGTFTGNTAYYSGGVIRHTGGGNAMLTIKDGLFENNSCTSPNIATSGSTGSDGCAGGVLLVANNASIQGGVFRGNTSTYVGGVMFVSPTLKPVVDISGGTFENNKTTGTINTGGGAILSQSKLLISGGTFKGNSSGGGGAINLFSGGSLTLSGGTFEGNSASRYGGAFQVNSSAGSFEMTGGALRNNTAGIDGGGINSNASMLLTGGTIENNTAQGSGGGLSLYALTGKPTSITLGATLVVQGNKSLKSGGGLFTGNADPGGITVNVQGASIMSNTASNSGGGLYNGGVLNLQTGSITGNTAAQNGGGLYNTKLSTFNKTGGSVTGNTPNDVVQGQ